MQHGPLHTHSPPYILLPDSLYLSLLSPPKGCTPKHVLFTTETVGTHSASHHDVCSFLSATSPVYCLLFIYDFCLLPVTFPFWRLCDNIYTIVHCMNMLHLPFCCFYTGIPFLFCGGTSTCLHISVSPITLLSFSYHACCLVLFHTRGFCYNVSANGKPGGGGHP